MATGWRVRRSGVRWKGSLGVVVLGAALLGLGLPAFGADSPERARTHFSCDELEGSHAEVGQPSPDDRCIRLYGSATVPGARGWARMLPAPTPFGMAVDREGVHLFRFEIEAKGLPDPSELGPYERYVAWLTPPTLSSMTQLGTLEGWGDGSRSLLGVGGFNTFLLLISAEGPGELTERQGPLVLRGSSPSMVLRPHDLPVILAEMTPGGRAFMEGREAGHDAHRHEPHGAHGVDPEALPRDEALAWRPPAMHPEVSMPHQIMALRPSVSPFLPVEEGDGVPTARAPSPVHLADGDTLILEAGPVIRRVGSLEIPGYGFNGQSPGPRIEAAEGSRVHVLFRNRTPLPSAVHWHGLRLDWPFDGVPGVTQDPVASGEDFHYELALPDEGTFWYHPHLREDVMQDLGLAGNIRVHPADGNHYDPVDHEDYLVLDDHLIGPEGPVPYGLQSPIHALMGRFGNRILVNGTERWEVDARPGQTLRLHLTNAAAVRPFNLSVPGRSLKLQGSDVGALPETVEVENVVVAPAERWVVDLHLPEPGRYVIENRVQGLDHMGGRFFSRVDTVGVLRVEGEVVAEAADRQAAMERPTRREGALREVSELQAAHLERDPDRTLILDLRVGDLPFPLDPLLSWESTFRPPVEWEGAMPDMDWLVSGDQVDWILRDVETGRENMEIDWRFEVGDRVKLRLVNRRDTLHPMHHPIHLHGQRFLVLSVDGVPVEHPSWKDTVLVPVGSVVDLVVEMDNPGPWMLHCHISEHLESGMMAVIQVGNAGPE